MNGTPKPKKKFMCSINVNMHLKVGAKQNICGSYMAPHIFTYINIFKIINCWFI